jgi:hypothetical protein
MTKEDRDRAQARADKATRAAQDARSGKADRDAASKAVLDNMAKLKALRLAREAAEPPRVAAAKKVRAKAKAPDEKAPACPTGWQTSKAVDGEPDSTTRLRRARPIDQRSRLVLGVVDLHLKHLESILQSHAGLFGRLDRLVMRFEMTVHDQRVTAGRRLVGADNFARLRFVRRDAGLLHASSV